MGSQHNEVRQQVLNAVRQKKMAAQPVHEAPKGWMTKVLGSCIMVISILTAVLLFEKGTQIPSNKVQTPVQQPVNDSVVKVDDLALTNLASRVDALSAEFAKWSERVWLLSVANNENCNLRQEMDARQGVADTGYIVFEQDWKINRAPRTIPFDEGTKARIDSQVK